MATPPTLESDVATAFGTATTPKTVAVTAASGRILVAAAVNSEAASGVNDLSTPTGGPSWTIRQDISNGASCIASAWTATSAGDYTHSQAMTGTSGSPVFGAAVWVYSGSDGYDASAGSYSTTEPPTQAITTTTDNCAIVWAAADYQAGDDAARAYVTINGGAATEDVYFRDASFYTVYMAHWADAGTAGAKTAGLASSDPATMETSQFAVAIKGTAGATPKSETGRPRRIPAAIMRNRRR